MKQTADALLTPARTARRSDAAVIVEDMVEGARMILSITAALIESGRRVDLAGLDDEFGRLCAGILALPLTEGQALRPMLETLSEQLAQLHAALPPP
ncbi:hypothetical protein [Plastoroseomonas arctica]|uniref:Uncharacterized protein n=1 Tax=Plastoroseomonas arctica TaxID=1509237 RepID=A0AAF1K5B6_9PROT|nr:hypothetical protein [Plastoroseomonas arctica]MBR0656391.1 hypothetical protein [Plastoroseomonas arctica]